MSDLIDRLRDHFEGVSDKAKSTTFGLVLEAADRIDQLEERMRGADALIVLWETRATRAEARVEQLEAALREIGDMHALSQLPVAVSIARAALDQSSPPKARAALAPEQKK